MSRPFIIPVLDPPDKLIHTIPYTLVVPANSNRTILSSAISGNLEVVEVKMLFDNDHVNNVLHYWIVSGNPSVSTTGVCSGENIFARFTSFPYFVGDSLKRVVRSGYKREAQRTYLKLHITNNNAYPVTVNGEAYIRELE